MSETRYHKATLFHLKSSEKVSFDAAPSNSIFVVKGKDFINKERRSTSTDLHEDEDFKKVTGEHMGSKNTVILNESSPTSKR